MPDLSRKHADEVITVLVAGVSHPHGSRRQRQNRKSRPQPSSLMFLQKQLAEAKSDLQAFQEKQAHDDSLRDITFEQQRDRNLRLENIIAACVESILSRGSMPNFLRKMIEHDAPGALTAIGGPQIVLQDAASEAVARNKETVLSAQTSTTICRKPVPEMNSYGQLHIMTANDIPGLPSHEFLGWAPDPCLTTDFFLDEMGHDYTML